jgi:predicted CopG family antitoxin
MQYTTLTIRKDSYEKLRRFAFKKRKSMASVLADFAATLDRKAIPKPSAK